MAKKRVYLEPSAVSYLTAKTPRDVIKRAKHLLTRDWWERRGQWELLVSRFVLDEIADGDPRAAAKRLEAVRGLAVLPEHALAEKLARDLAARVPIPEKTKADAAHIALAAFHGMDYLVTWNQKHLDNVASRGKMRLIITNHGFRPAEIVTPERLLEDRQDG